jgi:hypothetical protein
MPLTKGIIHFDESAVVQSFQSRQSPKMWFRIYTKKAKGPGGRWIKAAIAPMTATKEEDFVWHDFYKIKSYGATQPGPEKSEPGKESGWVCLNVGNGGMEYFSWTKLKRMEIIPKDLKNKMNKKSRRTNRCRDPINLGFFTTIY